MKEEPRSIKYSELLGDWLNELGYTHCFMVAGGGCMHLIDGFRSRFVCVPVVHEMSAGIAAEHFNECTTGGRAFALVTTGPGLTNIVTAIAGCYAERRELLVIAGQVKSSDQLAAPLRQRGIQEVDGVALTRSITVESVCLDRPAGRDEFRRLALAARRPHPGPVVIEVCLDVQGARVEREALERKTAPFVASGVVSNSSQEARTLAQVINGALRPLLLIGGLMGRKPVWDRLPQLEQLGIPIMTTTSAIDRVPSASPIFAGRPGTWGGQRAANMLIAQADVVVAIGAQLDLQQTGFNWQEFTPGGKLYQVYPCAHELSKGHPTLAGAVNADPDAVFEALIPLIEWQDCERWGDYARNVRAMVPSLESANRTRDGYISPFEFLGNLSRAAREDDILALCSSGGTFTGALQMYELAAKQYATTSAAFASMGYGLATAIGAAFAQPGKRVLLTEGDGGFAQNLQELAIVRRNNLPVKMFILDNHGYASIRATQRKFFGGAYVGCDEETGLGSPDWAALFRAYGIPAQQLEPDAIHPERLAEQLARPGPEAWVVNIDPEQSNWPMVSTRMLPDGKLVSNPLYQMLPPLEPAIAEQVSRYLPGAVCVA